MNYDQAIEKIMPEVDSGSNEPFIIYRDFKSDWHVDFVYEQISSKEYLHNFLKQKDSLVLIRIE